MPVESLAEAQVADESDFLIIPPLKPTNSMFTCTSQFKLVCGIGVLARGDFLKMQNVIKTTVQFC